MASSGAQTSSARHRHRRSWDGDTSSLVPPGDDSWHNTGQGLRRRRGGGAAAGGGREGRAGEGSDLGRFSALLNEQQGQGESPEEEEPSGTLQEASGGGKVAAAPGAAAARGEAAGRPSAAERAKAPAARSKTEETGSKPAADGKQKKAGGAVLTAGEEESKKGKVLDGKGRGVEKRAAKWNCLDSCCWAIGNIFVLWLLLLLVYHILPHNQIQAIQEVLQVVSSPPNSPGKRMHGTIPPDSLHPVIFVPGIVTGGLELWEGRPCADGLFRKKLWGGTFGEVYKRPACWMEHLVLDNETGLDPPSIRLRPVTGLVAADYFMPGYFVWAVLIEQLAMVGYDEGNLHMAVYDWRLSFQKTEVRDQSLTRLKAAIELMVKTNGGRKAVIVAHSMGTLYFLFFLNWVQRPPPLGGGGGPQWVDQHIKSIINVAGPLLGAPKAFSGLFSAEAKDVAVFRALAPVVVNTLQTLQYVMRVSRTWPSTLSMLPKGGEAIWGNATWAPDDSFNCSNPKQPIAEEDKSRRPFYGRMVSFGSLAKDKPLDAAQSACANEDESPLQFSNVSCGDVWTEYHEMSWRGVCDVAKQEVYTSAVGYEEKGGIFGLLNRVAPRMMKKAAEEWSYGVASDLDDPEYEKPKYWANPLETRLPDAPNVEIFCFHGVGLLTERAYAYRMSPHNDTCLIPFQIDASVYAPPSDQGGCLKDGAYFVNGDETVPTISSGLPCAKLWKGKTKFNPSGSRTFVREFDHAPPASLLEGRGTQSGSHVDILGNYALIEDLLKLATGQTGEEIGGDRIYSQLESWASRVNIDL